MIVAGELHKLISVGSMSIATLNAVSVVSCIIYKMIVHVFGSDNSSGYGGRRFFK
jgi:hypothetical protein